MDFFDLHCDSPYEAQKRGESFIDGDLAVTVSKGELFRKWAQICAVWIPDECLNPKERYRRIADNFLLQTEICTTAKELEKDRAFLLSLEGGAVIDTLDDVDMLYSDGVRVVTLTWNGKNKIAGGSNTAAPLTDFGREVIEKLNSLKMVTDLSHLNDRSFSEVIKCAKYPIATHVCCRDVYHVRRNITDEQIRAITQKGGIIGLCLYPKFLGDGDVFSDFLAQLYHLCDMGLEDFLAIGSDFDGAKMDKRLDSIDKMPVLYNYLKLNGFNDELLYKLFYKNAKEYFLQITE